MQENQDWSIRMLKKTTLLAISALSFVGTPFVFAQSVSRESPNLPRLSEPLASLDHGVGWFKDEVGEWHHNDRAIGDDYNKNIDGIIEEYNRSQVEDYKVIELKTLANLDEKFYVLLKHHFRGHYRYPNISQDWTIDNAVDFCAFAPSESDKVSEALEMKGTAQRVSLSCTYGAALSDRFLMGTTLEDEIIASIVIQRRGDYDTDQIDTVHIDVFPIEYEGENLVRFHWRTEDIFFFDGSFDPATFDESYYEVDFASFEALFNPQ